MKCRHIFKIILITSILLITISGCSVSNKSRQDSSSAVNKSNVQQDSSSTVNKSNVQQDKESSNLEEKPDLEGRVLSIGENEITIAKASYKGNNIMTCPKKGAEVKPKDMEKIKITGTTKIIVRNCYNNGLKYEDKAAGKEDIKEEDLIGIWVEKNDEDSAKDICVYIFNK
ncbi:hypothetical protein [Clostridium hydrogenum]|uniref:hypothetical protein n=1 Tax=Clostridium hydrogenum TaxID=2855764 RepID=UPI001F21E613|nr:hypothetical protein [Clostridium hydrogenum]